MHSMILPLCYALPLMFGFTDDDFSVDRGQMTFDAEGMEGGNYHSRKPHVPSDSSGITIGRGYDLKHRTRQGVICDMKAAGISEAVTESYASGVGLSGDEARRFVRDHRLPEITPQQQKRLFHISYTQIEKDVIRICSHPEVVKAYGPTDWRNLDPKLKDVLVDLRYRGDYTPRSRKFLQRHVANNDVEKFATEIFNKFNWPHVPADRFNRRKQHLKTLHRRLLTNIPR